MGILSPTHLIIILVGVLITFGPVALVLLAVAGLIRSRQRPVGAIAVPPAWLQDPTGRHQFRFWDGRSWTAAVSDNGQVTSDEATQS